MRRKPLALAIALIMTLVLAIGCAPRTPDIVTKIDATSDNIADFSGNTEEFTIWAQALENAGLGDVLREEGPYTAFIPTNEAWERLPEGYFNDLMEPENRDQLQEIIHYHIVARALTSRDLITIGSATQMEPPVMTEQGADLEINATQSGIIINEAAVIMPDILAANGVVHGIDHVLLPPSLDEGIDR